MRRMAILLGACAAILVAGCGGDDDGGSTAASPDEVTACVEEQGFQVESVGSALDEQIGLEDSLQVKVPAEQGDPPNAIKVSFFESEDAATEQADGERTFIEGAGAGGSVEQDGSVVVTIARSGNDEELEAVQDCL